MKNQFLANKIRSLREQKAWSQSHLADASGLNIRTIQRLEKSGACSKETLLSVAAAFDVDVEIFTSPSLTARFPSGKKNYVFKVEQSKGGFFFSLRNRFMGNNPRGQRLMALAGIILLLIPLSFIILNVCEYTLGFDGVPNPFDYFTAEENRRAIFNLVSPFIFLGSLTVAFILNVVPFLDIELKKKSGGWLSYFRYQGTLWNWSVIGISLLSLAVMASYFISENIGEYAVRSMLTGG